MTLGNLHPYTVEFRGENGKIFFLHLQTSISFAKRCLKSAVSLN